MKKVLALDFDDVTVNSSEIFLGFLNQYYGTNLTMPEATHFEFEKHLKVSREEINERWMEFDQDPIQKNVTLLPGAYEMIMRLSLQCELHVVTNRPSNMAKSTLQLIQKRIPGVIQDVHFCSRPDTLRAYRTKSSVCKHIGAAMLLEDHPKNVAICAADGIHVYLFEQPWNRGYEFPFWEYSGAIVPVKNWHDPVLETLFG